MKSKRCIILAMVLGLASTAAAQTLQIEGSTTVGPIGDAFAEAFMRQYPDLSITVNKTGSGHGVAALIDGRCDIAMSSRFMKIEEFKTAVDKGVTPVAHIIAMDGVCPVVHPSNRVGELTTEQIRSIYEGKITNWRQLGGVDMPIVPISRDTSSGTYETFNDLVMHKSKMVGGVEYVNGNPQMHARVSTTPGAIGYLGIGFLDSRVKTLKVDGVTPDRTAIQTGRFPIARPLYLFTNGYPRLGSMPHLFVSFYLTEAGQDYVEGKGFIPMTNY